MITAHVRYISTKLRCAAVPIMSSGTVLEAVATGGQGLSHPSLAKATMTSKAIVNL